MIAGERVAGRSGRSASAGSPAWADMIARPPASITHRKGVSSLVACAAAGRSTIGSP